MRIIKGKQQRKKCINSGDGVEESDDEAEKKQKMNIIGRDATKDETHTGKEE